LLVAALRVKLKSEMTKFLGSEGWKTFTEKQKQYVISCYFQLVYGISEYQMTELLAEKGYA
jgi:hypothetical protein